MSWSWNNGMQVISGGINPVTGLCIPLSDWPTWAKALKWMAKPVDTGIGDTVARIIGEYNSDKFKAWHRTTFGKDCNCTGRQARWNKLYPYDTPRKQSDTEH